MKQCRACGAAKSLDDFHRQAKAKDGHQNICKKCAVARTVEYQRQNPEKTRAKQREWHRKNPDRKKIYYQRAKAKKAARPKTREDQERTYRHGRKHNLKRMYGLTVAEYEAMVEAQSGLCAICHRPPNGGQSPEDTRKLDVDHDHDTGAVRDLLCNKCNGALGLVDDDSAILWGMIRYLRKHGSKPKDPNRPNPNRRKAKARSMPGPLPPSLHEQEGLF